MQNVTSSANESISFAISETAPSFCGDNPPIKLRNNPKRIKTTPAYISWDSKK